MALKKTKSNQPEILDLVVTPPNTDITMTMGDYHQVMYPNANDAGYVAVATKKAGVWSQRMRLATDWYNHVDLTTNCYLSVNTFFRPLRQTRAVRHLNTFFLDLDIYNAGVSQQDVFGGTFRHFVYAPLSAPSRSNGQYTLDNVLRLAQ